MGLLLLRLPLRVQRLVFGRSGRVFGLGTSRGRGGLAVFQHRLGLAPGGLVDAPARDLFDEELGEGPHQRIGAVGRGAAAFAQARRVGRIPFWLSGGRQQPTCTVNHTLSTRGLSDDGRIAILGGTAGRTEVCYFGRRSHGRWWGWPLHGRRRNRLRRFLDRRTLLFIADRGG